VSTIVAIYWISLIGSFLSVYMLASKGADSWLNLAYYLLGATLLSSIVIALAYVEKTC
jgi:hypothetical protein